VYHPAFVIAGWGEEGAALTVDGVEVHWGPDYRVGHRRRLDSTDLIVWTRVEAVEPVRLILRRCD
jgi:hypothetical protein